MGIKNLINKLKNKNMEHTNNIMLYTEQTPNPETLKYVSNKMLFKGTADFRTQALAEEWSEFSTKLYELPYVQAVYISNNFVTIQKGLNYDWQDIMLPLKEEIKKLISSGVEVVKEGYMEAKVKTSQNSDGTYSEEDAEVVTKIKELLDTYVKPAVEADGGNIAFHSFDEGKVTVEMQGACSGCPSSTITLKAGIEGMLKRMIPEVKEVVSTMEQV